MLKVITERVKLVERKFDDELASKNADISFTKRGYPTSVRSRSVVTMLADYLSWDVENMEYNKVSVDEGVSAAKQGSTVIFTFKTHITSYDYDARANKTEPVVTALVKDNDKTIFAGEINANFGYETPNGTVTPERNKNLYSASYKYIEQYALSAYIVTNTGETERKALKQQRADAQSSTINRYENGYYSGRRDKSGYIVDKDKYKKMLVSSNQEKYVPLFNSVVDLYNKLTQKASEIETGVFSLSSDGFNSYYTVDGIAKLKSDMLSELSSFSNHYKNNNIDYMIMYAKELQRKLPEWQDKASKYLK